MGTKAIDAHGLWIYACVGTPLHGRPRTEEDNIEEHASLRMHASIAKLRNAPHSDAKESLASWGAKNKKTKQWDMLG